MKTKTIDKPVRKPARAVVLKTIKATKTARVSARRRESEERQKYLHSLLDIVYGKEWRDAPEPVWEYDYEDIDFKDLPKSTQDVLIKGLEIEAGLREDDSYTFDDIDEAFAFLDEED